MDSREQTSNSMEEQWPDILKGYFGKSLSAGEAEVWMREIQNPKSEFGSMDTDNRELAKVIRWVKANPDKASSPKYSSHITISLLRNWIAAYRREQRKENSMIGHDCACSDGWVRYIEQQEDGHYLSMMIPCNCKAGRYIRSKLDLPLFDYRVPEAFAQQRERKELLERLAEEIGDDRSRVSEKRQEIMEGTMHKYI